MNSIPKTMHFIWIGDESLCPHNCIKTWQVSNPDWEIKIWGNHELENIDWINKEHMQTLYNHKRYSGVADLLRWEILYQHGGFTIDADSVAINPIPDWLNQCELVCCWENEIVRPGLLSNGFVGSKQGINLIKTMIDSIKSRKNIHDRFIWYKLKRKKLSSWETTGPMLLTQAIQHHQYNNASILPSHFSLPIHFKGLKYTGTGPVICSQLFSGTNDSEYEELYKKDYKTLIAEVKEQIAYD